VGGCGVVCVCGGGGTMMMRPMRVRIDEAEAASGVSNTSAQCGSHSVLAITNKVGHRDGRGGVPLWLGARKSLRPCVCVCVCVCVCCGGIHGT